MTTPDTVTEAIEYLIEQGYTENMQLINGEISWDHRCASCSLTDLEVDRALRFEGDSDPGDEMVVLALRHPVSGVKGVLASAYGSAADPLLLKAISGFDTRFERR